MSKRTPLRRWAALAAVAVTAVTVAPISTANGAQAADAIPPATLGATIDYFDDVYDDLGANSVFETVTIERFEYILKNKPGSFAFLIGDPNNASTQETIGHIDAVAKSLGVDKIYNFTPKLDGATLDVWNLAASNLRTGTSPDPAGGNRAGQGLAQYETLGNRLLTDYLNQDTQTQFTKNESTDPYLFVYDKGHTASGQPDRIVSALSGAKTAADLDTVPEQDAYRAEVATVLGSVPDLATNTQFEFLRDEHNRRHYERAVKNADPTIEADNLARFGGDILDDADAANGFRVENITYPELIHLVQQPGDFALLFGGTWCHNTAAIIKDTNRIAQEQGIKKVYNFDFSLASTGNGSGDALHSRDNALAAAVGGQVIRPSHLYGDLVNEYLTNAVTQYRKNGDPGSGGTNFVGYYPGGDTTKPLAEARKIQVGHVLTYNKDRVDEQGQAEPVIDQAIRQNDDGGNTEHMTEWWYVKGRDYPAGDARLRGSSNPVSETGSNQLQSQRAFAKEGIDEIETLFKGFSATDIASTTTVAGIADGADLPLGATPTVEVTVSAAGFAPFISLNTANQNLAPPAVPLTGKPRGFVGLFDGDTQVAEARVTRQGTASFTLPAQTAGEHELTVRYLGRGDLISASEEVVSYSVVGDPSATTLSGPALAFEGVDTTFEATVSPDVAPEIVDPPAATGTVQLTGLPGDPIEAPLVAGAVDLTVPATTPAGTYEVTALYQGDATYGISESEPLSLTILADPTFTDVPTTHQFYGDIKWLVGTGVGSGYADGTFKPSNSVSRQAVASFLYKFAGSPAFTAPVTATFADVPTTHQFYKEIEWLAQSGITAGYADDTFRPTTVVSRQAVASFLYKFAGSPAFTAPVTATFADVPTTHQFYKEIEWLAQSGITAGYADDTFRPTTVVSRQAVASFLHKYDTTI